MVHIGDVPTFEAPRRDKEQALKVLEEAAETFGKWQDYDLLRRAAERMFKEHLEGVASPSYYGDALDGVQAARSMLLDECADVIQAACNLLAAFGIEDTRALMAACVERNEARGRAYGGASK